MDNGEAAVIVFALAGVFGTIAMIIWAIVKTRRPPVGAATDQSARLSAQMEAMQGSIDAIALEVERITEGQRFTTRLLSERSAPAAGIVRDSSESR